MKRIARVTAVSFLLFLPVAFAGPAPQPAPPGTVVAVEAPPSERDFFEQTRAAAERASASFPEMDRLDGDSGRLQGSSDATDPMDVSFPATDSGS